MGGGAASTSQRPQCTTGGSPAVHLLLPVRADSPLEGSRQTDNGVALSRVQGAVHTGGEASTSMRVNGFQKVLPSGRQDAVKSHYIPPLLTITKVMPVFILLLNEAHSVEPQLLNENNFEDADASLTDSDYGDILYCQAAYDMVTALAELSE